MVNSYCDQIRALGVRCIVSYVERTAKSPDSPLSLEKPASLDLEKSKAGDIRGMQTNTLSIISNVGQGALIRGLAAIGPSVRSALLSPSKLTARVVYKLMWHLLKSHRFRLGHRTQASLIRMVLDDNAQSPSPLLSFDFLKEKFVCSDNIFGNGVQINMDWADLILTDITIGSSRLIRDSLGIGTIMRLLRFLPSDLTDQWLKHLLKLCSTSLSSVETASRSADWQPCLFQLISYSAEQATSVHQKRAVNEGAEEGLGHHVDEAAESSVPPLDRELACKRLDLALDLYALLMGHCFREGGDKVRLVAFLICLCHRAYFHLFSFMKAIRTVEETASLQRVCLNGQEVFCLILSRLLVNLSELGVIPVDEAGLSSHFDDADVEEISPLLKRSAKLVTQAIISNGVAGLNMPAAVGCWRCLRHLTAVAVAMITKCG